jgi:hypothetical protein
MDRVVKVRLSLPGVIMMAAGAVLMYAAVKNKHPVDVIREAIGQKAKGGPLSPYQGVDPGSQAGNDPTPGGGPGSPGYTPPKGYGVPEQQMPLTWPTV